MELPLIIVFSDGFELYNYSIQKFYQMEFVSVKSILLDSEKKKLINWIVRESRNEQTPSGLQIRRKAVEIRNKRNDETTPRFV